MWKHADTPKWDVSPNQTQCFRAVLHHVCLTCGSMQTNPNEMYPPNWSQCFRAVLHHICLTCGSMQKYWNEMYPPKMIPVLHNPTTPCPFDMWKHADILKWDVSPLGRSACFPITNGHGVVGLWSTGFDWGDTSHFCMCLVPHVKQIWCSRGYETLGSIREDTSHFSMSACFHMSNGHGVVGLWSTGIILGGYISFQYFCILPHVKQIWCSTALKHWDQFGGYISFGFVCMLPHVKQTWCSTALKHWVWLGDTSHLGVSACFHMLNRHGVIGLWSTGFH